MYTLKNQQGAHSRSALQVPPYPLLNAPSTSPLLCGPQWLLMAHGIFTTSSHPQSSGLSGSERHVEGSVGKQMQRPSTALREAEGSASFQSIR